MSPLLGGQTLREEVEGGNKGDIFSREYTFSQHEKDAFESDPQNHLEL
jgi:hypothetical protein